MKGASPFLIQPPGLPEDCGGGEGKEGHMGHDEKSTNALACNRVEIVVKKNEWGASLGAEDQ